MEDIHGGEKNTQNRPSSLNFYSFKKLVNITAYVTRPQICSFWFWDFYDFWRENDVMNMQANFEIEKYTNLIIASTSVTPFVCTRRFF